MHLNAQRKLQLLFYVDILLMGLGAVAVVLLVHDAFIGGFTEQRDPSAASVYVWRMASEVAFLTTTLAYFLTRFYKARVKEFTNAWG